MCKGRIRSASEFGSSLFGKFNTGWDGAYQGFSLQLFKQLVTFIISLLFLHFQQLTFTITMQQRIVFVDTECTYKEGSIILVDGI